MHLIWREIAGKGIPQFLPISVSVPSGEPNVTDRNSSQLGPLTARSTAEADSAGPADHTEATERSATPPPPYTSVDTGA